MSVRVRPYRRGGWEIDILVELPDGTKLRERKKSPVSSKSGSLRWGQARERELLRNGGKVKNLAPTLSEFAPRFMEGYAVANRHKPSGLRLKEIMLRVHLLPHLGDKRLDKIRSEDIQDIKKRLCGRSPSTVNNALTVLRRLLKVAIEWDEIDAMPCVIRQVHKPTGEAPFLDFDEYSRLARAADESTTLVIILLGGDAGLRLGEILALRWVDVDLNRKRLTVRRSDWNGIVGIPKGRCERWIPLTSKLYESLKRHRHRDELVVCQKDGKPLKGRDAHRLVTSAARAAGLSKSGVHILRHTFVSHLAMRGAPARSIQELAGHANLHTTQRYMHLSPSALESSIRLLDRGDILETTGGSKVKSLGD